jgi:hypothetical protein
MNGHEQSGKRGRPPKFGRRGQVVAVTLPEEVVRGLRKHHPDLAWAIVTLFERASKLRKVNGHAPDDAELVAVGGRRSLIVVNRELFNDLPGVNIIPLHDDRAFLALEPGRGMPDLELAVIDRLAMPTLEARERKALVRLREQLRKWRSDRTLRCETRAIIVLERTNHVRSSRRPKPRA